jgi:putative heme-binding domain-containing protein
VATALRQFASGALTVDIAPPASTAGFASLPVLKILLRSSAAETDPVLPFLIWMAAEPDAARNPREALNWLLEEGAGTMPLSGQLARKTMRRICDLGRADEVNSAVNFAVQALDKNPELAAAALDGLIEGQKGKALLPSQPVSDSLAKLSSSSNPQVAARAQQLGALWGDAAALKNLLAKINDSTVPDDERIKAIQAARQTKDDSTRRGMVALLSAKTPDAVAIAAIQALSEIGGENVAQVLIGGWKAFSPAVRRASAETLAARSTWREALLGAVENKVIAPSEISATVVRSLANSTEPRIRERTAKVIGRFRESDANKLKLIAEKKKVVLAADPNLESGHEVARKTCLVCHKLHGEGAEVGPDLTGVGRSTLDALLANVIDPNQLVGKGYENTEIETRDGRTVSGRIVEDTETRIKLLSSGPKEEVIAKADIASLRTSDLSVMPEGLEQLPDADFRNLIWYILNPPQDKRPWTPALRKELFGDPLPSGR